MRNLNTILLPTALLLIMQSCSFEGPTSLVPAGNGSISLYFTGDPMPRHTMMTKASDSKTTEETRINQLYIFFFDDKCNYIEGSYLQGYGEEGIGGYYVPGEGVTSLNIANEQEHFENLDAAGNATIFAIANVSPYLISSFGVDDKGRPDVTLETLENTFYQENSISIGIPAYGMPMTGKSTGIDLLAQSGDNNAENRTIKLEAMMARVDISIRVEDTEYDAEGLPKLTMLDWSAVNLPKGAKLCAQETGVTELTEQTKEERITTERVRTIMNMDGEISLSFYMYENMQEAKPYEYPDGATNLQRYKPLLANGDAAAVEFHCMYNTYNDSGKDDAMYEVTYTVYLGANHTDDFTVRRNHQYHVDITIQGLLNHKGISGEQDIHSFDARVNMESGDYNRYHLSILREREHDAHFCVTPMDVYFFNNEELQPKLEIYLDPDVDWIGMELIKAEYMESGTLPPELSSSNLATGSWTAGHGKRKYFTTSLVRTLNEQNKQNHIIVENNRDRVYLYIDEFLKATSHEHPVEPRKTTIHFIYTDKTYPEGVESTLEIQQVPLIEVKVYGRDDDGNRTDHIQTVYMEQFEEYLNHYDPLEDSSPETMYTGLPWASVKAAQYSHENIPQLYKYNGGSYEEPQSVYYDGLHYTAFFVNSLESDEAQMNLNETPRSAFQYCHNRNKRTDDGRVPVNIEYFGFPYYKYYEHEGTNKAKWFLHGIRQMEDALITYNNNFEEFQNFYYWSSSAARERYLINRLRQSPDYARATKYLFDEGKYAESGRGTEDNYTGPNGTGGRAPRTLENEIRIRAFRIDLDPYEY